MNTEILGVPYPIKKKQGKLLTLADTKEKRLKNSISWIMGGYTGHPNNQTFPG